MKRIFSGVQPTGNLHLGNYLGAVRNWVRLQNDYECVFSLVDMHAITLWQDPAELTAHTREVAAAMLAAGVDVKKNILFVQSQNPNHAELAWILNCVTRLGWLNRMTQFKDKAGKNRENASVGLYAYPNLMSADILVYQATHVPVGEDQKQHLELARDTAQKFNNDFGVDFFPLPEPLILGAGTRIMSLRDGSKKMSKSDTSDYARINMTDDQDAIALKLRKAKTDPLPIPATAAGLEGRPEAANLLGIWAALSDSNLDAALAQFGGSAFSDFKRDLTDLAVARLAPINAEMRRLLADPATIDAVLREGGERARALSQPIMDRVKEIVGFLKP
ncbi:MAG: tryptophan--tRNA ligase [Rhodospirillaceae bacterium]|nr:tryptophan--tRNA ligase [Rhodospirillaceae bacterium]